MMETIVLFSSMACSKKTQFNQMGPQNYVLNVRVVGNGNVQVNSNAFQYPYLVSAPGASIDIPPDSGVALSVFSYYGSGTLQAWQGSSCSGNGSCSFVISQDETITATFQ